MFMYKSCYYSLQDETSKRSTQTNQEGINELLDNDQQVIDHDPKREQEIAQCEYERIEECQRSSCIVLAHRTLKGRA